MMSYEILASANRLWIIKKNKTWHRVHPNNFHIIYNLPYLIVLSMINHNTTIWTEQNKAWLKHVHITWAQCAWYQWPYFFNENKNHQERRPLSCLIWGIWNILARPEIVYINMFQNVPCSMPDLSWKFMKMQHMQKRWNHNLCRLTEVKIRHNQIFNFMKYFTIFFQQACVHPVLELWHPVLKKHFKEPKPLQCAKEKNWVQVDNGSFVITQSAMNTHGSMTCICTPHIHGDDDNEVQDSISFEFKHGDAIPSDIFSVKCSAQDGAEYKNLHSGIAYNFNLHERHTENPLPNDAMGVNILMFGFDSTSRMSWMRNLPKSHQYYTQELGGLVLEGYNIVGDGTPRALLPILCGKTELELPESRRGFTGAQSVDGYPWIWRDFKDIGYVTQWGEDNCHMGTFTRRLCGFKQQPVDHYLQPFCIKAEKQYKQHKPCCLGSLPRHTNMLNWINDFYNMYDKQPKFSFVFHSELTHDAYSSLKVVDEDLLRFLHNIEDKGYLNNTILILMADHGPRINAVRQTEQGKYEERMPYFSFRFPPGLNQNILMQCTTSVSISAD